MKDFSKTRKNMADCQLKPTGVLSPPVLSAFETVPREKFIPGERRNVAYIDDNIPLGGGAFLMTPSVFARMVQAAEVQKTDVVLNVGDVSGYSAAILSLLAGSVVAPDAGGGGQSPCNLVFLNGSVAEIPVMILDQLMPGGRLVGILRRAGETMGQAVLVKKLPDGGFSHRILFDAATPYIPGFEPRPGFVF